MVLAATIVFDGFYEDGQGVIHTSSIVKDVVAESVVNHSDCSKLMSIRWELVDINSIQVY